MNWRQNTLTRWSQIEPNKWGSKVKGTNYLFIIIEPLQDGIYTLTYMDADLKDYTKEEKETVLNEYKLSPYSERKLALKLMEHYGHYEWKETLNSKQELLNHLEGWTSFELSLLRNLKEN
ncbi:hypothetical protein [Bacillus sp. FJAT-29937]|uniref:hypothetical protein n=1 Tax=Bacillus sp. FJAT-29937 TaxID=1720553 RepID=UPI000AB17362|nr:hypothetical protein [Bacillus sp. FJAT-29937]